MKTIAFEHVISLKKLHCPNFISNYLRQNSKIQLAGPQNHNQKIIYTNRFKKVKVSVSHQLGLELMTLV